jgi:hypothetical protein
MKSEKVEVTVEKEVTEVEVEAELLKVINK